MWDGTWHSYTLTLAIDGKLKVIPYQAMSDNDAHSRFYIKLFKHDETKVCAYELVNDETGEVLTKRYSPEILDYI
jgi:hypothetical protein